MNEPYVMGWSEENTVAGQTLLERVQNSEGREHLTRITIYAGYPLGQDFKHVLDINSIQEMDTWLLSHTRRLDEFVGTYQRRDEKIRYPGQYDTIKNANYVRVENFFGEEPDNKLIWYGMITNISYVNDKVTNIDWVTDSWNTFKTQREFSFVGHTFVERSHVDDFVNVGNGEIKLANINPEQQTASTATQISDVYDLNFGGSWSDDINFAIYWLMPNFGSTDKSPTLPEMTYSFEGAPSMLQPFMFAYNIKTGMTVPIEVHSAAGNYTTDAGNAVTFLIAALATDPDVVGHRNFVSATATEYFGMGWRFDGSKVIIDDWGSQSGNLKMQVYKPAGQNDSMLYFSELTNAQSIVADLGLSAYQMARASQLQTLRQEGMSGYVIKNVKTSMTPYTSFQLRDGFGGLYEYDTSLINYENPNAHVFVKRIGGAGYTNKVHTAIQRYKDLSSDGETGKFANLKTVWHGILQTEDKSLPIVSDTFTATNAVNVNSNKMVYKNAENTRQNNHLSNQATLANMNTGLKAQSDVLKNNQSTARKTMDMKTGANLVEGLGSTMGIDVPRGAANAVTGALGGAIGGIGGGIIGVGLGAATGAYGGFNQTQIQETGLSNDRANNRINQAATRTTTHNSIQTSELIANNNYENAIENFQAQQADLGLAADNLVQQGGDVFFSYSNGLNLTKLIISTETADRIIQVDTYFTMFGYNVNRIYNANDLMQMINSRTRYNYIRTTGVKLLNNNIPEKDKEAIEMMFNSGVTIWHDTLNFMNYDLLNNQRSLQLTQPLAATAVYHNQLMKQPAEKQAFVDYMKKPVQSLTNDAITIKTIDGETVNPVQ